MPDNQSSPSKKLDAHKILKDYEIIPGSWVVAKKEIDDQKGGDLSDKLLPCRKCNL